MLHKINAVLACARAHARTQQEQKVWKTVFRPYTYILASQFHIVYFATCLNWRLFLAKQRRD